MKKAGRVIGAAHVNAAHRAGRISIETIPGDIVTALARDSAERLGVQLLEGPLQRPTPVRVDGTTAMVRALYRRSPKWMSPKHLPERKPRRLRKLGLIGAGGVGANVAHLAANADLADEIALFDIMPDLAEAVALDLNHARGITRSRARATGSGKASVVADSDVVVVTAGRPRTPGMSRTDLIDLNGRIVKGAAEAIKTHAPNAIVIVVTNPVDEMTVKMHQATGFPRARVLGMAGTLDSSRFRNALALAASVEASDVEAITLGSHGDEMVPIISSARIKGRPIEMFLSNPAIKACVSDAVTGGGQIVALRRTGSATLAPAHATIELIDHLRGARAGPTVASVMLEGEYGISGVVLGVPCVLGAKGLIRVEEIALSDEEHLALREAAAAIFKRVGGVA
jgi:malate dehydrogenase